MTILRVNFPSICRVDLFLGVLQFGEFWSHFAHPKIKSKQKCWGVFPVNFSRMVIRRTIKLITWKGYEAQALDTWGFIILLLDDYNIYLNFVHLQIRSFIVSDAWELIAYDDVRSLPATSTSMNPGIHWILHNPGLVTPPPCIPPTYVGPKQKFKKILQTLCLDRIKLSTLNTPKNPANIIIIIIMTFLFFNLSLQYFPGKHIPQKNPA